MCLETILDYSRNSFCRKEKTMRSLLNPDRKMGYIVIIFFMHLSQICAGTEKSKISQTYLSSNSGKL
jgi:hypothetical protein